MKKLSTAVLTFACAAGSILVHAATYYVEDAIGDDSRDETAAQSAATPWKTISKAAATSCRWRK